MLLVVVRNSKKRMGPPPAVMAPELLQHTVSPEGASPAYLSAENGSTNPGILKIGSPKTLSCKL